MSRRWIGFGIFVVALAGVCVQLGAWQFDKLTERENRNALVTEHLAIDPVELDSVAPAGQRLDPDQEWTVATATGRYDLDRQVTVKYVSRDGRPGVDVLTPLVLDDGTALLVNRGFVETPRSATAPSDLPDPATTTVEVTGWLRPNSGATGEAIRVSDAQVRAISSDGLADHVPYDLRDGYLNLQDQSTGPGLLDPEPRPELGPGTHLAYGLQWWFFGALALTGFVWFAHAERQDRRKRISGSVRAVPDSITTPEEQHELQSSR
ncbi:SURF1 family cytochrome oxidase biogenesis protein [Aeromicrobium sp. Sec7.5]|uniref:SURF1 family cytochrome oxidase biogenesis protein n=1 Tax=Aeromicrobium sp. Sec7.5 TaxID=3121276 RepID=UPI002FE4EE44